MKAIVCRRYGVLTCEDIDKPGFGDDDVLLRVRAAAVNPVDRMYDPPVALRPLTGFRRPRDFRIGHDVAGEVEAVGKNVTRFKPGDAVFGTCKGALAEYACAKVAGLMRTPTNASFEQAAGVAIAGLTALQALRTHGRVQPRQAVLIDGLGGVGTFAVQIAKSFGARVTAVTSTSKVELARSLGADRVIDYTRADFTRDSERYDLIVDCVGNRPLWAMRRVMQPRGACVVLGAKGLGNILARWIGSLVWSPLTPQRFVVFVAKMRQDDLATLADLIQSGKLVPVIDRMYPLRDAADAFRYLETRRARGKIVVTVSNQRATS